MFETCLEGNSSGNYRLLRVGHGFGLLGVPGINSQDPTLNHSPIPNLLERVPPTLHVLVSTDFTKLTISLACSHY